MPIGNLRGLANASTRVVNENVAATLKRSTGSTTAASGKRTPQFSDVAIVLQVQAMDADDLKQMDGLNIQGVFRAIYLDSQTFAIVRVQQKGGDLIVFPSGVLPEGTTWLATHVLERWPNWCKVAITLQEDQL